ncbi:MAG: alpha-amylase family glycosyl hydrolase [Pseudomonadota bacterium]
MIALPDTSAIDRVRQRARRLVSADAFLEPYRGLIVGRLLRAERAAERLSAGGATLTDAAGGHQFFGLHRDANGWLFREWAPHATRLFFIGDFSGWEDNPDFEIMRVSREGVWELRLPPQALRHGDIYKLRVHWDGGHGERIPAYARRVVQDWQSGIFNAQIWSPEDAYLWRHLPPSDDPSPLIYEAHVGMALEDERIGTFREFTENRLPRIAEAGYNTIQLMAVQEHPYYGSFGYQVSNFFAVSSRFGTPEEFKALVDEAHGMGLRVVMDLIHSHAVANEIEGLGRFDGTADLYFHEGERGWHSAWGSRCFDYGKPAVVRFLLSNCRYWLEEYRVDGFRFDGITSMLYRNHGLGKAFTGYADYFSGGVDEDALAYLLLANRLIHTLRPGAITIAEDVSGMPGLAAAEKDGGVGFDYRFAMGIPDYWIRMTKDTPLEAWAMGTLWHELTNRRNGEKTISYAESHDQALVGDQTLIYRLLGAAMYDAMHVGSRSLVVDNGMALHKMIRLITLATAGGGYLNFMGNEFGHPEWVDFPRSGNEWSYRHARRQWALAEDPGLRYQALKCFDECMIRWARDQRIMAEAQLECLLIHEEDKVIAFRRGPFVLAFNFHAARSHTDYHITVGAPVGHRLVLDSDEARFGGQGRLTPEQVFFPTGDARPPQIRVYLPALTAMVAIMA